MNIIVTETPRKSDKSDVELDEQLDMASWDNQNRSMRDVPAIGDPGSSKQSNSPIYKDPDEIHSDDVSLCAAAIN